MMFIRFFTHYFNGVYHIIFLYLFSQSVFVILTLHYTTLLYRASQRSTLSKPHLINLLNLSAIQRKTVYFQLIYHINIWFVNITLPYITCPKNTIPHIAMPQHIPPILHNVTRNRVPQDQAQMHHKFQHVFSSIPYHS